MLEHSYRFALLPESRFPVQSVQMQGSRKLVFSSSIRPHPNRRRRPRLLALTSVSSRAEAATARRLSVSPRTCGIVGTHTDSRIMLLSGGVACGKGNGGGCSSGRHSIDKGQGSQDRPLLDSSRRLCRLGGILPLPAQSVKTLLTSLMIARGRSADLLAVFLACVHGLAFYE